MDINSGDVLTFVASGLVLVAFFGILGLVFYEVDKRFKAWVARPRKRRR